MAELLMGGALLASAGGASQLWSYNRENYMWDKQNQQSRDFQVQNIMMGRYGLFREDIRDLANLTTSKMDSYLIVNTLKLGFIVTMFFNFDRTDTPRALMPHERVVVLFFTTCFLTSFFCLLTSIWFSMHATVVAQSFMTKMLVQTVRIPFPSAEEVDGAAPMAQQFETDIGTAFRMPFQASAAQSGGQPQRDRSAPGGLDRPKRAASTPLGLNAQISEGEPSQENSNRTWWSGLSFGSAAPSHSVSRTEVVPERASSSRAAFGAAATRAVTVHEEGWAGNTGIGLKDEDFEPEGDGTLPHLKLYSLLMAHWQPFDLYSKVTMSIGTSSLLSGMAYYGLFYARIDLHPDTINDNGHMSGDPVLILKASFDGWLIFLFFAVLAWWCVTFDLFLDKRAYHAFVAVLALSGPFITFIVVISGKGATIGMVLAFTCQALWIWFLSFTAITWSGELPTMWRASLYLDVLSKTGFGPTFEGDKEEADLMGKGLAAASQGNSLPRGSSISRLRRGGSGNYSMNTMPPRAVSSSGLSLSNSEGLSTSPLIATEGPGLENAAPVHQIVEEEQKEAFARGGRALCRPAVLLLKCLDIVLTPSDDEPAMPEAVRIKVQAARDMLYEASKAAGVLREIAPGGPAEGFLLIVPTEDGQEYPRLINPQPAGHDSGFASEDGPVFGGEAPSPVLPGGQARSHSCPPDNADDMPRRFASAPQGLSSSYGSSHRPERMSSPTMGSSFRPERMSAGNTNSFRMKAPEAIRRMSSAKISVAELTTNNAGNTKAGRLDELMQKTRVITKALINLSSAWTPKDAQGLGGYGGRTYSSPDSFAAQFRSKGKDSRRGIGSKASRFYKAGVAFIVVAWLLGIIGCYFTAAMDPAPMPADLPLRPRALSAPVLSHGPAPRPQPWFSPTAIACDASGDRLAFSDGVRAFALNRTTGVWAGPFSACGHDAVAVAFDAHGGLVAASGASIVPLDSLEPSDGARDAICALPHSGEAALEALALESSGNGPWSSGVAGLAIRGDGMLLALEATRQGLPRVAGAFGGAPDGQRLVDVSLRGERAWALDEEGMVLELDVSTGLWTGKLWRLQPGYQWLGLCAQADDGETRAEGWLALGRPVGRPLGSKAPAAELWHFGFGSEPSTPKPLEDARF